MLLYYPIQNLYKQFSRCSLSYWRSTAPQPVLHTRCYPRSVWRGMILQQLHAACTRSSKLELWTTLSMVTVLLLLDSYSSSNSRIIIMSEENNYSSTQRQPLHVGVFFLPMTEWATDHSRVAFVRKSDFVLQDCIHAARMRPPLYYTAIRWLMVKHACANGSYPTCAVSQRSTCTASSTQATPRFSIEILDCDERARRP